MEVSNPNLIVTALKPGRDESLFLRLYEATGAAASAVRVKLPSGLTSVSEVNLIEDDLRSLPMQSDGFQFDARGFEIKSFRLTVKPATKM